MLRFIAVFVGVACLFGCGMQIGVNVVATAGPQARAETHYVLAASDPTNPAKPLTTEETVGPAR